MDDADAFSALYEREAEAVMVFVARRTLDVGVAADVVAETFALALCSWSRVGGLGEEQARAWLFTVARRQVARYWRRSRVERRAVERLALRLPVLSDDDVAEVERRAGLADLRAVLGAELERLGGDQREALRLRVVEERSYEDVARQLGVSEQTARARVSRGLRALARALELRQAAAGEASR